MLPPPVTPLSSLTVEVPFIALSACFMNIEAGFMHIKALITKNNISDIPASSFVISLSACTSSGKTSITMHNSIITAAWIS